MDELINRMNRLLADSYQFYLKAHYFHWNVTGPNFPQYHEFLGNLYVEVYGSIDPIAEFIRTIDGTPQNSPSMLKQNSTVVETNDVRSAEEMMDELLLDTGAAVKSVMLAMEMADKFNEVGLSNFLQERHAAFKKHAWMLKSIQKK
jgi:starvation-inducible DNA-binding protein